MTEVATAAKAAPPTKSHRTLLWLGLAGLIVLLVVSGLVSLAVGNLTIPISTVIDSLQGTANTREEIIIQTLRVPRTVIAMSAGAAFATSGAIIQALTRNPLGDPGILGVAAGASLAVLIAVQTLSIVEPSGYMWFAFGGAAVAGVVVYFLGSVGRGGASPVKLAIAGAALASALGAVSTIMLSLDQQSLDQLRFWLVGSVAGRPISVFWWTLPFVIAGILVACLLGGPLNLLALGDEVAVSLGMKVGLIRAAAGLVAITLAGAGVAMAGPIAFAGLAVPHVARHIVGPDWRWIVPYSAVMGGILLLIADVVGRIIVRPNELQVGVVVALVGAPFFIALVRRGRLIEL